MQAPCLHHSIFHPPLPFPPCPKLYIRAPAPSSGHLTPKSDVYALGVVFLELLTGQPPAKGEAAEDRLTTWLRPHFSARRPDLHVIMDPRMDGQFSRVAAHKLLVLAKHCVSEDPMARPQIQDLVKTLQHIAAVPDDAAGGAAGSAAEGRGGGGRWERGDRGVGIRPLQGQEGREERRARAAASGVAGVEAREGDGNSAGASADSGGNGVGSSRGRRRAGSRGGRKEEATEVVGDAVGSGHVRDGSDASFVQANRSLLIGVAPR